LENNATTKKLRREKKMQILSDLEEKISLFVVKFEKKKLLIESSTSFINFIILSVVVVI
jgi:hypothetical protein